MNSILLHSTQGGSDKVYMLKIEERSPGAVFKTYDVIYANGRRSAGATAGNKAKNHKPLSLSQAQALMGDVIAEKKYTKGYHEMGECVLCGATTSVKQAYTTNTKPEPKPMNKELVKTFAPTWYERTISFDDEDL